MTETDSTQIVALLRQISGQLAALPGAIALTSHRGSSLTREDRGRLATLLPAINEAVGSAAFTTRDLLDEATRQADLRSALTATLGPDGAQESRRLGKLFARSNGFSDATLRIESMVKSRDGMLWHVVRVS